MAVINFKNNLCFVDHKKYTSRIYEKVIKSDDTTKSLTLAPLLFNIKNKDTKINKKRFKKSDQYVEEALLVKRMYLQFLEKLAEGLRLEHTSKLLGCNLESSVRQYSKELFEKTVFHHNGISGGNNSDVALECKIQGDYFLVPKKSRFYCGCIREQCNKLLGNKFDIVIADPPWWNKYIRRLKTANENMSYTMMYNEDIAALPVKELLADNCLIALWCTNAESNISAVKDLIYPQWGVQYLTTWYWLKLTVDLEPICGFSSGCKKQPYERLILGKVGDVKDLPMEMLFASVPSALHSHKPPLLDLLTTFVNVEEPQTLELFARYLLPNTTSIGYEPLKWQHISLYEIVKNQ